MPYVFGVDGGGSQSRAIFMTDSGKVIYLGRGPGVNYHDVGASRVSSIIQRLFQDALKAAHARQDECKGICLGLAGVGRPQDRSILLPVFDTMFGKEGYALMSDAEIALVSGTLSEYGILVISGTGSMIYGRTEDNQEGRLGGYGPLISDEGSGYHIGLAALKSIVRYCDGVGLDASFLQKNIFELLGLKSLDDLVNWANSNAATRERIASIAPIILRAANEDDPAADAILERQADDLALGVESLHKRLVFPERVDVVLSGGLFSESSYYAQIVRRKILYLLPGANVIAPKLEPVIGAALYAFSLAGVAIDEDLLDNIRRSYRECQQNPSPVPTEEPPKVEAAPPAEPVTE